MTTEQAKAAMNEQLKQAKAQAQAHATKVRFAMQKAVLKCCLLLENKVKEMMTDTKTALEYENPVTGNWVVNDVPRSLPGQPPAVQMGFLRRGVTHVIEGTAEAPSGSVGPVRTDPDYPTFLELGTSKMAPRPVWGPAYDAIKSEAQEIMRAAGQGVSEEGGK